MISADDVIENSGNMLWFLLSNIGRFDLIDLLSKIERREIKKIKINKQLVKDIEIHSLIINYMKKYGVEVIKNY